MIVGFTAVVALLVCIGVAVPLHPLSVVQALAVEPVATAGSGAIDESLASLEAKTDEARDALDASEGRVLDDSVRTQLGDIIRESEEALREARLLAAVAAPGGMPDAAGAPGWTHRELIGELEAATASVGAAVVAWEAEQARIAAEQEAARLAAEAAAAERSARAQTVRAGVVGPYVEGVWTSGGQPEVDACRGSVNLPDIAAYLGGSFYAAEHWSCGGRAWAGIETGELVSFPGYGVFRVEGRVGGLPSGSDASSLPSGYDGYYQTCMNGDSGNLHVWLLTRVG